MKLRNTMLGVLSVLIISTSFLVPAFMMSEPLPAFLNKETIGKDAISDRSLSIKPDSDYLDLVADGAASESLGGAGAYLSVVSDVVSNVVQLLIGLLLGLFIVIGVIAKEMFSKTTHPANTELVLLAGFTASAFASCFCAFKSHQALLLQVSELVVYPPGLESPLAWQAGFLLMAAVFAFAIAALAACTREERETEA